MRRHLRHAALATTLLAVSAASPTESAAQTILNVERLQPGEVTGWHASVQGAVSLSGGNSEYVDLSGGFAVGHRWRPHWVRLFTGLDYRSETDEKTKNNRFVHLRYGYEFGRLWQSFHFVQLQRSESLMLRERALFGSGLRRTLLRTERTQIDIGSGAMYERELLDTERLEPGEEPDARVWRMANLFVVTRQFRDNLRLVGVGYLQPDLSELADYRAHADAALLVGLGERVDLALRFELRHDSRPPAALASTDYLFHTGLVLSVR